MSIAQPNDLMSVLNRLEEHRREDADPGNASRRFRRFAIRTEGILEPLDLSDGHTYPVMLRDISRNGVGFLCEKFIEPCTLWRIRFIRHNLVIGSQPMIMRYCRLIQPDLYILGGQFIVEPHLMLALGVNEEDLRTGETLCNYDGTDISDFVSPDES
jgi:hypothetical protein